MNKTIEHIVTAEPQHQPSHTDESTRRFRWSYLVYALLVLPLIGVMVFAVFQPIKVLPRMSLSPGFSFTDQDGGRLTNEDLRGKYVFYNFTYTGCETPCPDTSPGMRDIQQRVSELEVGDFPVEFVTISFDPEQDAPNQLRAYADELGADTSSWHFVTGDPTRLKNVIGGGFGSYYEQKEDGAFAFDPMFVLVDGWGIIRSKYRTPRPDLDIIERDIGLLTEEVNNSEGASRIAYEAAHLFLCYPD